MRIWNSFRSGSRHHICVGVSGRKPRPVSRMPLPAMIGSLHYPRTATTQGGSSRKRGAAGDTVPPGSSPKPRRRSFSRDNRCQRGRRYDRQPARGSVTSVKDKGLPWCGDGRWDSQLREAASRPGGARPVLMRCSRILRTSWGSVMRARTFMGEPQRLHFRGLPRGCAPLPPVTSTS